MDTVRKFKEAWGQGWRPPKYGRAKRAGKLRATKLRNESKMVLTAARALEEATNAIEEVSDGEVGAVDEGTEDSENSDDGALYSQD